MDYTKIDIEKRTEELTMALKPKSGDARRSLEGVLKERLQDADRFCRILESILFDLSAVGGVMPTTIEEMKAELDRNHALLGIINTNDNG